MQKIGVFVCWCGTNIASTVDVKAVAEAAKSVPGVVFSTDYQYMCSEAGQNLIKDSVLTYGLTHVVVCSCSPRMHEATFRKAVASIGMNPYMLEVANIREQCSWVHKDKEVGTEKAIALMKAAVAKAMLNTPLTAGSTPVTKRALVIGGGIAGMQTALDIADAGFQVDIVETKPAIGGKMAQLDKTFPTLDCSSCIVTPKMVEVGQHPNITTYAYSEVTEVKGFVGQFTGLPHDAVEELVGVFNELVHVEVLDGLDRLLGRLLEHFCQFLLIIIHDRSIGSFRFDRTYVIAHRARRQVLSSPLRSWTSWWRGGRWCGSR